MIGNLWEWCNGSSTANGGENRVVALGGSYASAIQNWKSDQSLGHETADARYTFIGFRVVCDSPPGGDK